jgi:hypothetical protein
MKAARCQSKPTVLAGQSDQQGEDWNQDEYRCHQAAHRQFKALHIARHYGVVGNRIVVHIGLRPFQPSLAIVIQASTGIGRASCLS